MSKNASDHFGAFGFEFRLAARALRREWLTASVLIATLAIGIGANSAVLTVTREVLLRPPLHVIDPTSLFRLVNVDKYPKADFLIKNAGTIDVASYARKELPLSYNGNHRPAQAECVTGSYFRVLGTSAHLGRVLDEKDDSPGSEPTVVLDYDLSRRLFGALSPLGQALVLARREYRIVGVLPKGFAGTHSERTDVWLSLARSPTICSFTNTNLLASNASWVRTVGRLREGIPAAEADQEIRALTASSRDASQLEPELLPVFSSRLRLATAQGRLMIWLAVGSSLLLLISCVNVAGLLSLRAVFQHEQIALRALLGASSWRLWQHSTAFTFLIVLISSLASVWIFSIARQFLRLQLGIQTSGDLGIENLSIFTAIAVVTAILSGSGPAMQAFRSARGRLLPLTTASRRLVRAAALVTQIALAFALLASAALFLISLDNLKRRAGFNPDNLLLVHFDLEASAYSRSEISDVFARVVPRIRELAIVESVAMSHQPLLRPSSASMAFRVRTTLGEAGKFIVLNAVSPGYFAVTGTPVRGRDFKTTDNASAPPVAVVSEEVAMRMFGTKDVVGRCLLIGRGGCAEIVGVSGERRHVSLTQASEEVFVPLAQAPLVSSEIQPRAMLIKVRRDSPEAVRRVAAAVYSAVPSVPFINIVPVSDLAEGQAHRWNTGASMFGWLAGGALVLAVVGVYVSTLTFTQHRLHEFAIRIALGASGGRILIAAARFGLIVSVVGVAAGVFLMQFSAPWLDPLLFETRTREVTVLAATGAVVLGVTVAACLDPVWRATRDVRPVDLLRKV